MVPRFWLGLICFFFFNPGTLLAGSIERSSTIDDVITLNTPQDIRVHTFAIGGGVFAVLPDVDFINDSVGGSLLARYTYRDTVSIAGNIGMNEFSVGEKGISGDVLVAPSLISVLIHAPAWNNIQFYAMGGIGYQFNDAKDVKADLNVNRLEGKLVIPSDTATVTKASDEAIAANARAAALKSIADSSPSTSTTTTTGATVQDAVDARAAADAAALAAADANAAFAAAQKGSKVNLNTVSLPANLEKIDLEIKDGLTYAVGVGADVKLNENLYLNLEVSYQLAQFDIEGSLDVAGLGTIKISDEKDFDSLMLRTGLLWRF